MYVCATIGTTSSCAVDPVGQLAHVAHEYGAWIHVDAAYAGSAAVCPLQREAWFQGLEVSRHALHTLLPPLFSVRLTLGFSSHRH
jgi:glutamate/tyrosine decarboxylase-like PLP-dependent enzyme